MSRKYGWAASVFALTLWAAASHAGDVVPLGTPTAAAGCCTVGRMYERLLPFGVVLPQILLYHRETAVH